MTPNSVITKQKDHILKCLPEDDREVILAYIEGEVQKKGNNAIRIRNIFEWAAVLAIVGILLFLIVFGAIMISTAREYTDGYNAGYSKANNELIELKRSVAIYQQDYNTYCKVTPTP